MFIALMVAIVVLGALAAMGVAGILVDKSADRERD